MLWVGCSHPDKSTSPNDESCMLCHRADLQNSRIHDTHVNFQTKKINPFFKLADSAGENPDFNLDSILASLDSLPEDSAIDPVLLADTTRPAMYACNVCHMGYTSDGSKVSEKFHQNGKVSVIFDTLFFDSVFRFDSVYQYDSTLDSTIVYRYIPDMKFEGQTCSNIPCHGTDREGLDDVEWNPHVSLDDEMDCMSCHDQSNHRNRIRCGNCHDVTTYDGTEVTNFYYHVNGYVEEKKKPSLWELIQAMDTTSVDTLDEEQ